MASVSQSWNSILKCANPRFKVLSSGLLLSTLLQSLALLNLVLTQLKAREAHQAFLDANEPT